MDGVVLLLINVVAGLCIYSKAWARQALPSAVDSNVVRPDQDISIDRESLQMWLFFVREK